MKVDPSRWLGMCVLIQALLAAPTASAQPVSPAATKRPEGAAKNGTPSRNNPPPPAVASAQGIRMEIASFLERQTRFRKYDDEGAPKLTQAIIAGPVQYTPVTLYTVFSSKPVTVYCVEVDLIMTNKVLWVTHDIIEAVVKFPTSEDGKARIEGIVRSADRLKTGSFECRGAQYAPFPELEQLRDNRRHELGKITSPKG